MNNPKTIETEKNTTQTEKKSIGIISELHKNIKYIKKLIKQVICGKNQDIMFYNVYSYK